MGALSNLRVAELSEGLSASYCAKQFVQWGAEVAVLEPPDGTPLRRLEPLLEAGNGSQVSIAWEFLAAGKRSVRVDLSRGEERTRVGRLLASCDAFVTDWPLAALESAGLAPDALRSEFPSLVIVRLSPFGPVGPYAGYQATDLVLQALSGFMSLNGLPGRHPLKAAANLVPYAAGVSAFVGALAALCARREAGGQVVEVALLEAITSLVPLLRTAYSGLDGSRQGHPLSGTFMFECADGYVSLNPGADRNWSGLVAALALSDAEIPESLRVEPREPADLRAFLDACLKARPAREVFEALNEVMIACGLAMSPRDLLADPHLAARGYFASVEYPLLGHAVHVGPPAKLSTTPASSPVGAPPLGDADALLDASPAVRAAEAATRPPKRKPLDGVRIVDLTQAWLGPYATMVLADLGADVIKLESPHRPDVWRGVGVPLRAGRLTIWEGKPANPDAHPWNTNANFNSVNRNKRCLALDLARSEGKEVFLRLVARADLVMENFTPRVMDNFGLGYETLRQVKPDLVMVSFSGYGQTGPYRNYRANGATTDTTCGWAYLTGYAGGPPTMLGAMEADPITGLQMAATALVALAHRNMTGDGQHVEGSMFETCAGLIGDEILPASLTGRDPERRGNRHSAMAPHGVFPCAGDDDWVAIAVRDDADWRALLAVAGPGSGLDDERYAGIKGRRTHEGDLEGALAEWTRGQSASELMARLQAVGVPAGRVNPYLSVLRDPHLVETGWFQTLAHPDMGAHPHNGFPWRFEAPLVAERPSPRLGEHTREVLAQEAGLSEDQIDHLYALGVVATVLSAPASKMTATT